MLTLVSKSKMLLLVPVACTLFFHTNVFSQNTSGKRNAVAKFANIDGYRNTIATYEQILSDPNITFTIPGWKVLSFTLSFEPKGKDYFGPYMTKGSKLTDKEIDIIKKFRESGIQKVKVYLEDIKATGPDGQVRSLVPLIFTIEQH